MTQISLKFDDMLLEAVKAQAAKEHVPYQTWIKMILAKEIEKAKRRKD